MNRIIGSHGLNRNSSRSHCILTIQIVVWNQSSLRLTVLSFVACMVLHLFKYCRVSVSFTVSLTDSVRCQVCHLQTESGGFGWVREAGEDWGEVEAAWQTVWLREVYGCFYYINMSFFFQSKGQTLKEAVYINRSLSFLEQTILALADCGREHVPFRQSKLTHVLKDSLGKTAGPCICVFFAKSCCVKRLLNHDASVHSCRRKLQHCACGQHLWWGSTDRRNSKEQISDSVRMSLCLTVHSVMYQHSSQVSTLRFASRMKCVQTDPAVNEHMDPAVSSKWHKTTVGGQTWLTTMCFLCQSASNSVCMKCAVVSRLRSRNLKRMYRSSKRNFPSARHWWVELHTVSQS